MKVNVRQRFNLILFYSYFLKRSYQRNDKATMSPIPFINTPKPYSHQPTRYPSPSVHTP